jgi:hypothetical protein
MKLFLYKITCFIIPIVLAAYPLDILLSKMLASSNGGEISVWNDIYSGKIKAEIAVYGSSRAWVHISPKILNESLGGTPVYNFGVDGQNFRIQYLRNIEFQKYNPSPSFIIHSVDSGTWGEITDLYGHEQFLPYMLWNSNIYDHTKSFHGFSWYDYHTPLSRYAQKGSSMALQSMRAKRNNGYLGVDVNWNSGVEKRLAEMGSYTIKYDYEILTIYDRFLSECQEKNIQVILVYTPEHITAQSFVTNRDEGIAFIREFAQKYNLHFLDYSSDPLCYDKQYFYNATHLNKKGSELFSRQLAQDLRDIIEGRE